MENIPPELRAIGELLRTQDNRVTDQPMFIVQEKRIVIGFDPDYSQGDEDIVWWIDDCQYFMGDELFEKMERAYEETSDIPENWHRHGFTTEWVYVTACFTEQGCKDYLAKNGHNLKEPRIYADGSYRNAEFRLIRDWLMTLSATPPAHGHRGDWYLMANARRFTKDKHQPNWVLAMELFATGSKSAHQICADAGIDPYSTTIDRSTQPK